MKKSVFLLFLLAGSIFSLQGKTRELKVLQMNIWQEGTMVKGGFDAIADEVARLSPDIVLFSEIRNYHGKPFISRLLQALQERGTRYYGENSSLDVGILSRYRILEQHPNYPLQNDRGSVLKARLQVGDRIVVVYSAHLDYTHYACYLPRGYDGVTWGKMEAPIADPAEIEKANGESFRDEAVRGVIEDAGKEEGNIVILGGDFNEPSHLDWGKDTRQLWDHNGAIVRWGCSVMLERDGFKDAYREVHPDPVKYPGFTFPSDNRDAAVQKLAWAPEADERDRIDFVYFKSDKRLKPVSASIVGPSSSIVRGRREEERSKDEFVKPLGVWPTDHKAVLVTFKFKS